MVETFGDRLQQALIDKGWKQIDLANATGFSKARDDEHPKRDF